MGVRKFATKFLACKFATKILTRNVIDPLRNTPPKSKAKGLSHVAGRIILASMSALLSPLQDGKIWRVKIVWPNGAVHHFGKFPSEKDAIAWIDAHPRLTKPEDTIDEP